MELFRVKSSPSKGRLAVDKTSTNPTALLRSLHFDNLLIKRKLREIETRLDRFPLGIDLIGRPSPDEY